MYYNKRNNRSPTGVLASFGDDKNIPFDFSFFPGDDNRLLIVNRCKK